MLLVTSTLSVQVDTPGTEPLVRLIIPVPATAVGVPPHVFATPGVGATVTPAGNASVKSSPVVPPAFAVLSIVNVSVLVPPLAIGSGANAFVNTGETEGGLNSASTVTSLPTVTVHGLVVQPPPEKVTKAPDVAVAVSSTMVPVGTTSEQVAIVGLGVLGFVSLTTLFSAMATRSSMGESLLPVLVFPLLVPVVVYGSTATARLFAGRPVGEVGGNLRMLAAFAIIFTVARRRVVPVRD